jgi:hypothetical protein
VSPWHLASRTFYKRKAQKYEEIANLGEYVGYYK